MNIKVRNLDRANNYLRAENQLLKGELEQTRKLYLEAITREGAENISPSPEELSAVQNVDPGVIVIGEEPSLLENDIEDFINKA